MCSPSRRVALVDDDPEERETLSIQLEDAGFKPIPLDRLNRTIGSAVDQLCATSDAAICDHRLNPRQLASFTGAELVARLYDRQFPAVLVSGFLQDDQDASIRRFRDKIPVILSKNETTPLQLREGIQTCIGEIAGKVNPERHAIRSLIRVVERRKDNKEDLVSVVVPAWRQDEIIRFPASLLGEFIGILPAHGEVQPSLYLIGWVNVGASRPGDLFFRNFELAPEPRDDDGLA